MFPTFKTSLSALAVFMLVSGPQAWAQDNTAAERFRFKCIPAIKIVADLGYCFGFTVSYFEALEKVEILAEIEQQGIEASVNSAHNQCYATSFTKQKRLGEIAFSSYVNLSDDTLLRRSAADCRVLMEYYSSQLQD